VKWNLTKDQWLVVAETVDSLRIFPRLVLGAYAWFMYKVTFYVLGWYTHEPAQFRGTEETAMVSVVFSAMTGMAPFIFSIYSSNGRQWDPPAGVSTLSMTSVTKETTK
jgi:hypothetical protein